LPEDAQDVRERRVVVEVEAQARRVDEDELALQPDLELALADDQTLPLPAEWRFMPDGRPTPNVVRAIRLSRAGH